MGVTRHVGDALVTERSPRYLLLLLHLSFLPRLRSGRVVSIGIAPWGIVENRHSLVHRNTAVPYHSLAGLSPTSK